MAGSLTEGDGQERDVPDLVHRDFTADAPGEKMVADITLHFDVGGLAFPRDGYRLPHEGGDRWAVGDNYKLPLIQQAIEMAARNYPLAAGLSSILTAAATTRPVSSLRR